MNQSKSFLLFVVLLVVYILTSVNTVDADEDDAVDITERDDDKGTDAEVKSQQGLEKRTWGRHGWFRGHYRKKYYRPNRRPYRPYRQPVYNRYRYGYRRYRTYRYRKPIVRPVTTRTPITTPKPTTTPKPATTTPKPTTTPKATTTKPTPPCREGFTVLDKCQRVCVCRDGQLTDCYRVRREFTHISKEDRLRYLNAVLVVSTQEPYKTKYEALLTKHRTHFDTPIHKITYFLPWHRWFVLQYENLLREVDCRITVPYWDWSLVSGDPFRSEFWNDTYGFGGNGVGFPACVRSGPFSVTKNWTVIESAGVVPDVVAVAKVLAMKNLSRFSDFELLLRINLHDVIHFAIGGIMITTDSAAAPEFFPHHSFVDKIWTEWQGNSNLHRYHNFFLVQNTSMPGTHLGSADLLSNNNLPGCVKVKYVQPELGNWNHLIKDLMDMAETNPKELDKLPRMASAKLKDKMFEAFNVSEEERKRAREMQKDLKTEIMVDPLELKGMEKMIGMKAKDIQKMKNKTA